MTNIPYNGKHDKNRYHHYFVVAGRDKSNILVARRRELRGERKGEGEELCSRGIDIGELCVRWKRVGAK